MKTAPSTARRRPVILDVIIAVLPFLSVIAAVYGMARGLFRFLRGDESLMPVLWAIGVPIVSVLAALGIQMLLVKLAGRLYKMDEYEAGDDSPFL